MKIVIVQLTFSFLLRNAFGSECPDTWLKYDLKCYKFLGDRGVTFHEGYRICTENNATMASIHSHHENVFIETQLLHKYRDKNVWLGLKRLYGNTFNWVDKSRLQFKNWGPGHPNYSINASYYCGFMTNNTVMSGLWYNTRCDYRNRVLCQMEAVGEPEESDEDAEDSSLTEQQYTISSLREAIAWIIAVVSTASLCATSIILWRKMKKEKFSLSSSYTASNVYEPCTISCTNENVSYPLINIL